MAIDSMTIDEHNQPHRKSVPGVIGLAALLALGCGGGGEKTYHVSGTATFGGKAIPAGVIFFDPDPTKGGAGPQGIANINDGKYTTAVSGQGIRGGAYIIRVTGFDGKSASEAPLGKTLFNEYEMKKELPAADSELDLEIPRR